jgi:hypothetical protein
MSGAPEGLDDYLVGRRIAIGVLLDRMILGDLVRACSSSHVSEAEVAAALARFDILHEPSEASP